MPADHVILLKQETPFDVLHLVLVPFSQMAILKMTKRFGQILTHMNKQMDQTWKQFLKTLLKQ